HPLQETPYTVPGTQKVPRMLEDSVQVNTAHQNSQQEESYSVNHHIRPRRPDQSISEASSDPKHHRRSSYLQLVAVVTSENGPHRLTCLNTWFPVGGIVRDVLGVVSRCELSTTAPAPCLSAAMFLP
ncbi:mCG144973, partial [Mus musculus]